VDRPPARPVDDLEHDRLVEPEPPPRDQRLGCIQVFRIRDGQILLFRDCVGAQAMPDLTTT